MEYEVIIGMETHIELDTHSKMFCGCSASFFGVEPNTNVCPTCVGMPGALPVINKTAVEYAMLVGLALNCKIAAHTFWERKSYWYPDLPKGYQITQYQYPTNYDGYIDVDVRDLSSGNWAEESYKHRVRIRRAHLEEDTGKLVHNGKKSYADYNRSGVPLLEVVTEADIHSADEAYAYLSALRDIVRYLGVSTGDMEKGAMRCEPNLSLRPKGSDAFGTKVEIKNLNSLRAVRDSIAYEIKRQTKLLNEGGAVEQVTLGWDDVKGVTVVQRKKEDAHDYRYFPEPDLPPLDVSDTWLSEVRAHLPELPLQKQARYQSDWGLSAYDATVLTADRGVAEWFEKTVASLSLGLSSDTNSQRKLQLPSQLKPFAKAAANWLTGEVFRLMKAEQIADLNAINVQPEGLAELIGMVDAGAINNNTAKQVFEEMFKTGDSPKAIVQAKGLAQVSDVSALQQIIDEVIAANAGPVQQYLGGQEKLFGFLVGQAMKATKGKGNAQLINQLLKETIEKQRV
jgi:aspartyl-tRNA(Asn)/glutamyl-tRNA(Gln) amidotransferase subunit B